MSTPSATPDDQPATAPISINIADIQKMVAKDKAICDVYAKRKVANTLSGAAQLNYDFVYKRCCVLNTMAKQMLEEAKKHAKDQQLLKDNKKAPVADPVVELVDSEQASKMFEEMRIEEAASN